MFPGSGAQYCNMALDLYRQEVVFRDEIERCFTLIAPHLESDLKSVIYPGDEPSKEVIADLQKPTHTFTSLFVVEYAMAKLLMSWGITPGAMIGHSVGEYTAACLSGVFSLKDALALVALRGRLFETLPEGSMASVPLPADEVEALLGEDLSIAAVNRTDLCVVSGPIAAVDALRATLAERDVETARVHASFAPHSKLVEPILDEFRAFLETITFGTPEIPLVSNLTGDFVEPERVTVPDYWVRHLRETVHFAGGIGQLIKDPRRALIEVGPGQTLATLARQHPGKSKGQLIACTTRHPRQDTADHAVFLNTLGKLWLAGTDVDWDGFYASEERRRVPLPAYPFEREMYWMETGVDGLRSEQSRQPSVSDQEEMVQEEALVAQAETRVEPMDGERSLLGQLKMMLHDVSGIEIADIDPEATFAELGIDSLMMLQVTAALGRDFDIRIGPRELFQETPSLVLLAASIEKASPERWGAGGTISLPESRRPVEARHPSPREDTIARLKNIVEDITGHDAATVDPDASFIELGIDSLMIIQVSARIQKEFNTALDLNDLFDKARTLNALAGHIGDTDASIGGGTQPPIALRQKVASITAPIRDDEANVARKADITEWFYQPSWIRSPLAPVDSSSKTSTWLLFADDRDIHAKLAETLRKQGQIVVTITRGDRFEKRDDDQFSIRPDVSEDYARLVSALSEAGGSFTHIVHGWTYESTASKGGVDNSFDVSDAGFFSLLYLAQALPAADIRLFILTSALFSVNGSGPIDPLKATLLGPCRVIPKEMPRVHCRLIDLPVEDDQSPDEDLTAHLVAEFGQATTDQVVAYRDGERWLQTFSQARPADATTVGAAPGLKKSGIYLITGGFGDLGGLITNHLARAYQARLVLVGRTELPPREEWEARTGSSAHGDPIASRIGQILDLEALGAEVLTVSADVADRMQMDQAIQQTIARFGRFDGVIHAAGVLNDGIIPFKTRRDVEASFAAKITGTLVIEAVTKHLDLDFVALFSSTHAILAPPGQIAHSAANSFLDQFAQSRFDGAPRRYLTINWPLWHKVSLVGVDGGPWLQEARANGIGSADGIKAFEHALRCPSPQVILSPKNFADAITVFNRLSDSNRSQVDQSTAKPPCRGACGTANVTRSVR